MSRRPKIGVLIEGNHSLSTAEYHFRVLLWIQAQRRPTPDAVMEAFGCSRSCAYRYLASWRRATGQEAPKRGKPPVSQPPRAREAYSPSPDHPWNRRHVP